MVKQERTIVISKKDAELVGEYLNGKPTFEKGDASVLLMTRFDEDIEVFISLERADLEVLAQFHMNKEYIVSTRTKKTIVGTFVFNVYGTEYQVHVRTPEDIEEEAKRMQEPPNGYFIPKKKMKQIEELKRKKDKKKVRNHFSLYGWDEHNEELQEAVDIEEFEFATPQELDAYLNEGIAYVWKHYQVVNGETDEEFRFNITQTENVQNSGLKELKNWLYSLSLDFNS